MWSKAVVVRRASCVSILGWRLLKGRVSSRQRCLPLSAAVPSLDSRISPGLQEPNTSKGLSNGSATVHIGFIRRPQGQPPRDPHSRSRSSALAIPVAPHPAHAPSKARSPPAPTPPSSRGSPRDFRWTKGRSNLSTSPFPCPDACPPRGVAVMRWREVLRGERGSTASVSLSAVFRSRHCLRWLVGRLGRLVGWGVFLVQAARGAPRVGASSCGRRRRIPLPLRHPPPYPRPFLTIQPVLHLSFDLVSTFTFFPGQGAPLLCLFCHSSSLPRPSIGSLRFPCERLVAAVAVKTDMIPREY